MPTKKTSLRGLYGHLGGFLQLRQREVFLFPAGHSSFFVINEILAKVSSERQGVQGDLSPWRGSKGQRPLVFLFSERAVMNCYLCDYP
jgi:hypothetical protein